MRLATFYVYVFAVGASISHGVYYFAQMPQTMAVHFGAEGIPNGWSTKVAYFAVAGMMLVLNLLVFAAGPKAIRQRRFRKLSVPNREYWLSPGHIDEFYLYFRERMAWFGIVNIAFGSAVNQLVFSANSNPAPKLDGNLFVVFLIAYFAFVIIWLVTLFLKLKKKR